MDTITHGIVGALAGKAFFAGRDIPVGNSRIAGSSAISSPTARATIVACTLGSMFPDIDIFAGPLAHNPLAIMEWHRNVTHSAVLLPHLGLSINCNFDTGGPLAELAPAIFSVPLRSLCGGDRHAHFSRPRHQFWDHGLEPATIFTAGLGLDLHN